MASATDHVDWRTEMLRLVAEESASTLSCTTPRHRYALRHSQASLVGSPEGWLRSLTLEDLSSCSGVPMPPPGTIAFILHLARAWRSLGREAVGICGMKADRGPAPVEK